jgi:hypothetical protein
MANRGRRKIKDLVEMLENPEDAGCYIGGDYEDVMEELERGLSLAEEKEEELEDEDY